MAAGYPDDSRDSPQRSVGPGAPVPGLRSFGGRTAKHHVDPGRELAHGTVRGHLRILPGDGTNVAEREISRPQDPEPARHRITDSESKHPRSRAADRGHPPRWS